MTSTRAVLPQVQPMPTGPLPRPLGEGKAQGARAGLPQSGQDFAALFALLTAGGGVAVEGEAAAQAVDIGEELLPRRQTPGRSKALLPEDVFPPELLLTLYPQMARPPAAAGMPTLAPAVAEAVSGEAEADIYAALASRIAPVAPPTADRVPNATASLDMSAPVTPQAPTAASFVAALASTSALTPAAAPQPEPEAAPFSPAPVPAPLAAAMAAPASPAVQQAVVAAAPRPDMPAAPKAAFVPQPPAERRAIDPEKPAATGDLTALAAAKPERADRDPLLPRDPLRKTEFTVTRQETILPPVTGQPPAAHQAAEKIIAALQTADGSVPTSAANLPRETAPAPVRILHIQLQPQDLGTLTVKLSLKGGGLDVKLEAADPHTVRILEADRDRLTDMLRSAGYSVDALAVLPTSDKSAPNFHAFSGASPDNTSPSGGGAQQQGQSQTGGAQSDAQRGHASRGAPDQGGASGANGDEGNLSNPARTADGDLYI
jgi:chemotaxis protein MotD